VFRPVPELVDATPKELAFGETDVTRDISHSAYGACELDRSLDNLIGGLTKGPTALGKDRAQGGHGIFGIGGLESRRCGARGAPPEILERHGSIRERDRSLAE